MFGIQFKLLDQGDVCRSTESKFEESFVEKVRHCTTPMYRSSDLHRVNKTPNYFQ